VDKIDAEHLAETLRSRGYEMIRSRIEKAIAAEMEALIGAKPENFQLVQGRIRGLQIALSVPGILQQETHRTGN
jgi:hypothetical protein